jgi:chaperonin GroEL
LTGGQVVSEEAGIKLENVTVEMLGKARQFASTKTRPQSLLATKPRLKLRSALALSNVKSKIQIANSTKKNYKSVLAKLAGGVAVIKVGAATETELKDRKLRFEDALERYSRSC